LEINAWTTSDKRRVALPSAAPQVAEVTVTARPIGSRGFAHQQVRQSVAVGVEELHVGLLRREAISRRVGDRPERRVYDQIGVTEGYWRESGLSVAPIKGHAP